MFNSSYEHDTCENYANRICLNNLLNRSDYFVIYLFEFQNDTLPLPVPSRWHNTIDPFYKRMLKDVIDTLRRDLGMPPLPDSGAEIGGGDDGSGTGDGGDAEDEE